MKEEKMYFKIIDENGKEIECEVLFTFESDETNKNYIVYTDNTIDEEGNTKVYASIYTPNEEDLKLTAIETEKEWKIIETILSELQEEVKCYDPHLALDGGDNGLVYYERILKKVGGRLRPWGNLLLEIGANQGEDILKLAEENGYKDAKLIKDLAQLDRIIIV